jgi:serine/threonine-protein kinase
MKGEEIMSSGAEKASKFREESLARWESLLQRIFPGGIPTHHQWDDIDDIVDVLNRIGADELTNHTFVPHGGGLDLTGAARSAEPDCIELRYGGDTDIAKPSGLSFESFGEDRLEWAYFRLETRRLEPSGVYEELFFDTHEEVTDLGEGRYVSRAVWDYGHFGHDESGNELPLPEGARPVFRNFKGAFVIFAKGSIYNNDPATYDARHSKMSAEAFRRYIQRNIELLEKGRSEPGHAGKGAPNPA